MADDLTNPNHPGMPQSQPSAQPQSKEMHLQIKKDKMVSVFSNVAAITGTHEELFLDFAVNSQNPEQPNTVVMDVSTRVIMSYFAAKRLALQLSHAVQKHEQMFGPLEIDPGKRINQQR